MSKIFKNFNQQKKKIRKRQKNKQSLIDKKEYFSVFEVVIIVLIAILFGFIIGNVITFTKDRTITTRVPAELEELINTYNNIIDNYYDKKLDKKKLVDAGIKGLINYLDDPYSMYLDQSSSEEFNETINGIYSGIGATVSSEDGKAIIIEMSKNSPAEKAGLKVNDQIIKVGNKNVEKKSLSEITNLVKGKKGTKVKITVRRDGEEINATITRGNIEMKSVTSEIIEQDGQKVGYIVIDTFAANTYKQFKKELKSLESKNINSLMIDVRNNLGGHLNQVSKIMSLFLKKGKVIYQIEEKGKKTYYKDKTAEQRDYKVVILCNGASASASELLLAAFKESYSNAVTVGTKSYGKGTVQKAYELSSGASIKYTTEKWLTPKGNWLNKKGITPDVIVDINEEYKNDPTRENDDQFYAALEEALKTE